MNIKNVIIVNDFDYIQGGASKVAIDTANILKNKYNVIFFSAVHEESDNLKNVKCVLTNQTEVLKDKNKLRGAINGIYNIKAKRKFEELLKEYSNQDTIIHVHGWTKALSCSVFDIAFKMKFKVVVTLHDYFTACPNGGYFDYKKNKICKYKPFSRNCIACNCDSRNYLFKVYRVIRQLVQNKIVKLNDKLEYAIGISDLNIMILKQTLNKKIIIKKINNPIEYENRKKLVNWKNNEYYLYVGRISKEKGVETFCKVLTELGKKGIAVGDGSEKARLEQNYANIEFVGWKNKDVVKEYMRRAHCLIFPSLWYEGAPLVPLEAMSMGVPCIISNDCAAREYCKKNTYKTYKELKEKIIKDDLSFDSSICKEFTYQKYQDNLIDFYNKII